MDSGAEHHQSPVYNGPATTVATASAGTATAGVLPAELEAQSATAGARIRTAPWWIWTAQAVLTGGGDTNRRSSK